MSMGNTSGLILGGDSCQQTVPELATLSAAIGSKDTLFQHERRPALGEMQLQKRREQDTSTTRDRVASGSMQQHERSPDDDLNPKLLGGQQVNHDDWKGASFKDPWLVKVDRSSPWIPWTLSSDEEDITVMPSPHVGMHTTTTGVCRKCGQLCSHSICTQCGSSEFFPEAECGVEGCVGSLYSFHPECHCIRQPRCIVHAYWECTGCMPDHSLNEPKVVDGPRQHSCASSCSGGLVSGSWGECSERKGCECASILEVERRQSQLASLGWQVMEPASGTLSDQQKLDWAQRVLQSDPEEDLRQAARVLGPEQSPDTIEFGWWRGSRVSRHDAAIVLVGLNAARGSAEATLALWDGGSDSWRSAPSDELWRHWVSQGRKAMEFYGLDDLQWFTHGGGSGLLDKLCSDARWMSASKGGLSATVECKSGKLGQWVHWVVRPAAVSSIGYESAKELGLEEVEGVVNLRVKLRCGCEQSCKCTHASCLWALAVDTERADGIVVQKSMLNTWSCSSVPEPVMGSSAKWSDNFAPLDQPSPGAVDDWWCDQSASALKECLDSEGSGLQEPDCVAPDVNVLGAWVAGAFSEAVNKLEPIERAEMTYLSNPQWAKDKHNAQEFVAGKLHDYTDAWKDAGADSEVMSWLLDGVPIIVDERRAEVVEQEMGHSFTGINKRNGMIARENSEDFRVIVMDVLKSGAWEAVLPSQIKNKLPLNMTDKPGKDPPWRLLLNCMPFNPFVPLWSVKYETLRTVPLIVDKGDWLFSIDFTNYYYQLFFREDAREYLGAGLQMTQEQVKILEEEGMLPEGFEWDKTAEWVKVTIRPRGLAMGYKNSCAIATKLGRVITRMWRERGIKLANLLDDVLFAVSGTFEQACKVRDEVLADLERLGVQVNWKKSVLTPSKCIRFLGMLVDSALYRFFVPPEKVEKLKAIVKEMVTDGDSSVRALASVVGKIMSMQVAVPAVRMMTTACYALIRPDGDWDRKIVLTEEVLRELLQIVDWIYHFNKFGNPIRRYVGMEEVRITIDAGTGYGWRIDGKVRSLGFESPELATAADWGPDEKAEWQPWNELLAVEKCLQEESARLAGLTVLIKPDATTTVRYVNKGSGPSVMLTSIMRRIWTICLKHGISLRAEHFKGERMVGCGVDSLSRMAEFCVHRRMYQALCSRNGFGRRGAHEGYTVDLYASIKTRKCPKYAQYLGGEGSIGDARSVKLSSSENYWVCPPLTQITQAIMRILESGVAATIVVPNWPNRPWHVLLRHHAKQFKMLKWNENLPIMWDVCVKSSKHVHLVDKWDFIAFAVGGSEDMFGMTVWDQRCEPTRSGIARQRVVPGMWSKKHRRRAIQIAQQIRGLKGGACGGRVFRILSLCDGCSVMSLVCRIMAAEFNAAYEVIVVEFDPVCQKFVQWRFPEATNGWSSDVRDWADPQFKPEDWGNRFWFDLVVAGFPCQDLSSAYKEGKGLKGGRSGLFFDIWAVICKLRRVNPGLDFFLECVDFSKKFPVDFDLVSRITGVTPEVICASRIAACRRRRAFWLSFDIMDIGDRTVLPASVLEPGRWTDDRWLSCIMASGTRSWGTAQVVYDDSLGEWHPKVPLLTIEMEKAMDMPPGFTAMPGLSDKQRHHMIGNSFHVTVVAHIFRWWNLHQQAWDPTCGYDGEGPYRWWDISHSDWDATLGYEGEGPSSGQRLRRKQVYKPLNALSYKDGVNLPTPAPKAKVVLRKISRSPNVKFKVRKRAGRQIRDTGSVAMWKSSIPTTPQKCCEPSLDKVWGQGSWGDTRRSLLPVVAPVIPLGPAERGEGFAEWLAIAQHDFVISSKSDKTWLAYKAWMEVMYAWLDVYNVTKLASAAVWDSWVEVLSAAVCVLAMDYSSSTVSVFVTAVSCFMQFHKMDSPYKSMFFSALFTGVTRWLGIGKHKKPAVEAWHIDKILKLGKSARHHSMIEYKQAIAIAMVGWQLFDRPQDFHHFQRCDFRRQLGKCKVLIRKAKNDQKGVTRAPMLEEAVDKDRCPVEIVFDYFKWGRIDVHPQCDKVEGQRADCSFCPPAFPSFHKKLGKMDCPMPTAKVTEIIRKLFMGLADAGDIDEAMAMNFSAKSLRCGGVSQAAAEQIRDGVTQGHGGWQQRTSLVHYDAMRPTEALDVSHALNAALARHVGGE